MTSSFLSLRGGVGVVAALAIFLGGAALAQAPESAPPDRPILRQPASSAVEQPGGPQTTEDKMRAEADKKMREMDRRLNRTLRSVCSGC